MSEEIKISEEARDCAADEYYSDQARGYYVQQLLNQQVDLSCQNWKQRDLKLRSLLTQRDEEIAELRKDKARLDWLEVNKREGRWMPISRFWYLLSPGQRPFQTQEHKGDTLRQAIDLAMSKEAKGPPCT